MTTSSSVNENLLCRHKSNLSSSSANEHLVSVEHFFTWGEPGKSGPSLAILDKQVKQSFLKNNVTGPPGALLFDRDQRSH